MRYAGGRKEDACPRTKQPMQHLSRATMGPNRGVGPRGRGSPACRETSPSRRAGDTHTAVLSRSIQALSTVVIARSVESCGTAQTTPGWRQFSLPIVTDERPDPRDWHRAP